MKRQIEKYIERQKDSKIERKKIDRKIYRKIDSQIDKQIFRTDMKVVVSNFGPHPILSCVYIRTGLDFHIQQNYEKQIDNKQGFLMIFFSSLIFI